MIFLLYDIHRSTENDRCQNTSADGHHVMFVPGTNTSAFGFRLVMISWAWLRFRWSMRSWPQSTLTARYNRGTSYFTLEGNQYLLSTNMQPKTSQILEVQWTSDDN